MGLPAKVAGSPAYNRIQNCPAKLTLGMIEGITEGVRKGMTPYAASLVMGLGKDTFRDWSANYKHNPDCPPEIIRLFEEIEIAKADLQADMVGHIRDAAEADVKHWTAAAWLLERSDPESWGRNRDVTIRHESDTPLVQMNQVILGDANAREASRDFLRGLTRGSTIESVGTRVGDESENGVGPAGFGSE